MSQAPRNTSLPVLSDEDAFDPANRSLAEALRKSFAILKFVMLVLVILYFGSGLFAVKPNEVGLKLRYGRIVGADDATANPVLGPGWHWSWPYPIERWVTVPVSEREVPVEFMYQLTDQEKAGGTPTMRFDNLSPLRDDYLITGDVNILHASLVVKYRITDAVAYLTNVFPLPARGATLRSPERDRFPEYTVLQELARNAVIETAAAGEALTIRGPGQSDFLRTVSRRLADKIDALARAGRPLGITVDPAAGVLSGKGAGGLEGILPPRQVQNEFERVSAVMNEKQAEITKARAWAGERLLETAGQDYATLHDAVEKEFDALLALSAERDKGPAAAAGEISRLERDVARWNEEVERLLTLSSGEVQAVISTAQIRRDHIAREASGDYEQFRRVLPEYLRHPEIFVSRLRDETYAELLSNPRVGKVFVSEPPPGSAGRIWLQIPRASTATPTEDDEGQTRDEKPSQRSGRGLGKGDVVRSAPTLRGP